MNDRDLMQEALDALESLQAWPETPENFKRFRAIEALRARLSQPEQEPVAWMWNVHSGAGYTSRGIDFYPTSIPFAKHTPLYTAPPQREWVGLTDEESGAIMEERDAYGTRLYEFARAIEAKLKEKNT